jgi:type II secretory pathway pseudopilin PulG
MRIAQHKSGNEKGYILLSLMLMMTLMLIALTIEAPRVAQQIKREKEEELIHRGTEYRNAIKKYFRKFGRYPVSLDQLENTNNMRFLRKRYKDPFTGKDDWRLLHPGEVQLNVANGATAVPGQPTLLGQSGGGNQSPGGTVGQPSSFGATPSGPSPTPTGLQQPIDASGGSGVSVNGPAGQNTFGQNTPGSSTFGSNATLTQPVGSGQFGGGPIIGVASVSKLTSIKEFNGKNHYNEWPPFWYDPRQEQTPGVPGAPVAGAPGQFGTPGQGVQGGPPPGQISGPGGFNSPPTPPNNPMQPTGPKN